VYKYNLLITKDVTKMQLNMKMQLNLYQHFTEFAVSSANITDTALFNAPDTDFVLEKDGI
jgi:hypothetical protein